MSSMWEQLEGAAICVTRTGSIKDRLTDAFRNHLAHVDVEELPETLRAQFRACHDALIRERPLPGEDAVRATVRKISSQEADEIAASVVRLYGAFVRESTARECTQPNVILNNATVSAPSPRPKKSVPQVISLYAHEG
jgi:hypothetical protein